MSKAASRKDLAEAGRRKLEEFRKKKQGSGKEASAVGSGTNEATAAQQNGTVALEPVGTNTSASQGPAFAASAQPAALPHQSLAAAPASTQSSAAPAGATSDSRSQGSVSKLTAPAHSIESSAPSSSQTAPPTASTSSAQPPPASTYMPFSTPPSAAPKPVWPVPSPAQQLPPAPAPAAAAKLPPVPWMPSAPAAAPAVVPGTAGVSSPAAAAAAAATPPQLGRQLPPVPWMPVLAASAAPPSPWIPAAPAVPWTPPKPAAPAATAGPSSTAPGTPSDRPTAAAGVQPPAAQPAPAPTTPAPSSQETDSAYVQKSSWMSLFRSPSPKPSSPAAAPAAVTLPNAQMAAASVPEATSEQPVHVPSTATGVSEAQPSVLSAHEANSTSAAAASSHVGNAQPSAYGRMADAYLPPSSTSSWQAASAASTMERLRQQQEAAEQRSSLEGAEASSSYGAQGSHQPAIPNTMHAALGQETSTSVNLEYSSQAASSGALTDFMPAAATDATEVDGASIAGTAQGRATSKPPPWAAMAALQRDTALASSAAAAGAAAAAAAAGSTVGADAGLSSAPSSSYSYSALSDSYLPPSHAAAPSTAAAPAPSVASSSTAPEPLQHSSTPPHASAAATPPKPSNSYSWLSDSYLTPSRPPVAPSHSRNSSVDATAGSSSSQLQAVDAYQSRSGTGQHSSILPGSPGSSINRKDDPNGRTAALGASQHDLYSLPNGNTAVPAAPAAAATANGAPLHRLADATYAHSRSSSFGGGSTSAAPAPALPASAAASAAASQPGSADTPRSSAAASAASPHAPSTSQVQPPPPLAPFRTSAPANGPFDSHHPSHQSHAASLKLLQQHIDDLTTEKLELMRGLQQQARLNQELSGELAAAGKRTHGMRAQLEAAHKRAAQHEQELRAASLAVHSMAAERDACRTGAQEAMERAAALAAENVHMENELLDLKSAKLRLEKEAAAATGRAAKAEAALGALSKRSQDDREELGRLVAERRLTMARLMQAEAKVRVLSDKAPPGSDLAKLAEAAVAAAAASHRQAEVREQGTQADLEPPGSTGADGTEAGAAASSAQQAAALPLPPSSAIARKILAAQQQQQQQQQGVSNAHHSASLTQAKGVDALLAGLQRLLPSAGAPEDDPLAELVDEESRVLSSIHSLLAEVEEAQQLLAKDLARSYADNRALQEDNEALQQRLDAQQARLEAAMQQAAGQAARGAVAGAAAGVRSPLVSSPVGSQHSQHGSYDGASSSSSGHSSYPFGPAASSTSAAAPPPNTNRAPTASNPHNNASRPSIHQQHRPLSPAAGPGRAVVLAASPGGSTATSATPARQQSGLFGRLFGRGGGQESSTASG